MPSARSAASKPSWHALKTRDTETRAIEARLRQTMIELTGDPDGQPAAADAPAADTAPEDQPPPTARW